MARKRKKQKLSYKRIHVPTEKTWDAYTYFDRAEDAIRQITLWNGGTYQGKLTWAYAMTGLEQVYVSDKEPGHYPSTVDVSCAISRVRVPLTRSTREGVLVV